VEQNVLLGLVALSSLLAYLVGTRGFALPPAGLRPALVRLLELIGITVVFFAVNVAVGVAAILALRATTRSFVSIYTLNDITLVALSALQGVLFELWRARR
jgi:hypothetical protein